MSPEAQVAARRRSPAGRADRDSGGVLRRSDAADFAAAMDLDGAFGAPAGHAGPGSRTITLTRTPDHEWLDEQHDGYDETEVHRSSAVSLRPRQAVRRPPRSGLDRIIDAPDRIALMAVALGVLLVIIAAATSAPA